MSFMPGHFPAGAAVESGGVGPIVQQASATSTIATITAPADIIAGDILVLLDRAVSTFATPTTVVPTGFTQISNLIGAVPAVFGNQRQISSYKLATGAEASSSITGMDGSISDSKVLVTFRPTIPATSLSLQSVNGQSTSGNPTAQNVAAGIGIAPLIVLGFYGLSGGTIDPRTMTPAKDGELNQGTQTYIAWKILNSAPTDVTVDMDDEDTDAGSNILQSCYLQVS